MRRADLQRAARGLVVRGRLRRAHGAATAVQARLRGAEGAEVGAGSVHFVAGATAGPAHRTDCPDAARVSAAALSDKSSHNVKAHVHYMALVTKHKNAPYIWVGRTKIKRTGVSDILDREKQVKDTLHSRES